MRTTTFILAAFLLAAPAHVSAQVEDTMEVEVGDDRSDQDDGSRLGLLGLLGLAGLLGLRRREPDIHVDARQRADD